ncbi:hypothetical protein BC829DRAFT_143295 [Chytridium lagenaria]|nr:hypothetical protein BC829DRAFT_143295 [Chytridium lagenaria]
MFISGAGLGYNNAVGSIVASLDAVRNVPLPSTAAATPSSSSAQSLHVAILSVVGCFARIISGVVSDRLASRPQSTQRRRRVEAPSSEDVDRGSSDNLSDDGLSEPRRINVGTASLSLPSPTTTTRSITALYGSVDEPIVPPEEAFLSLESQSPPSPGPHVLVTRSLLNLTGSWWTLRPVNSNRSHVDETASLLGPRRIENESGRSWWKKVWWRRNGEGEGERTKFGFRYWGSWNRLDRVFWIGVAASLMAWAHWMVAFTTFSLEDLVVPTIVVGVAYGTIMTVLPVVVAEAFGPKLFATNWGVLRIATAIGGQAFGLAFGDLYDRELRHQFPNPENVMLRTLTASPQVQNSTTFNFIPPESTFASVATPQTLQNICQGSSCFSTAFAISFGCNILAAVLAFALFGKRQSRKFGASALGNQQ